MPLLVLRLLGDHPQLFNPGDNKRVGEFLLYFKRSYVQRTGGRFRKYMDYLKKVSVLPMTYPVADAYVNPTFVTEKKRKIDISCSLRGSKQDPTRLKVRKWVDEFGMTHNLNYAAKEVNHESRR